MHEAGLPDLYPVKTEADLFLWIYERRRDLRVIDPNADFAAAPRSRPTRGSVAAIEGERAKPLKPR